MQETPGAEHITALCTDLRTFCKSGPEQGKYDFAACNPPYFTGGYVSPDARRATARHDGSCTMQDVAACAARALHDGGKLALCHRPEQMAAVFAALCAVGLEPKRVALVRKDEHSKPWLFLVEAQKGRKPGIRWEEDVEGAREGKKEAFTKYFPNVSAVGTAFKANHGMMDMSVIPGLLELSMMDDGLLGGVTAIQPVFAGGQIVNGNKLADLALEVSRYQMRQSEDEVALTVERYYWQWISLHEKLRTIEIVESLVGSLYKDVEVAVGAGVTTRNDQIGRASCRERV